MFKPLMYEDDKEYILLDMDTDLISLFRLALPTFYAPLKIKGSGLLSIAHLYRWNKSDIIISLNMASMEIHLLWLELRYHQW